MRVLLVRPHVFLKQAQNFLAFLRLEPLDLELVAAGVDRSHTVKILDLEVQKKPVPAFKAALLDFEPDIIGFGGYSNQSIHVKSLAKMAKQLCPDILVVVGGVHATIVPHDFKIPGVIDVVIKGDGVSAIGPIVDMWDREKEIPESDYILPVESERFDVLAAKKNLPLNEACVMTRPRRDLVNSKDYYCIVGGSANEKLATLFPEVASMRTSVGCPHRCNFCVVHFLANGKYIQRDPVDVVDEIESIKQDYIYFVDDEMFINARRALEIGKIIKERNIQKKYISWARADTICDHPELFEFWYKIGLETVYVGLESLEERYLDDYNKGVSVEKNMQAVDILHKTGIRLHAAFIVNPDFEREDFLALRKSAARIYPAEVTFTVFSPSPGTELFEKHKDSFICDDPYLYYDCMHTLLPTKVPLKRFYRWFALLYLYAFKNNPWKANNVRAPFKDRIRLFVCGMRCGLSLRNIYKAYDKKFW